MPLIEALPPMYSTIPILVQYKLNGTSYLFRNAASYQQAGQWADVPGFTVTTDKRKDRTGYDQNHYRTPTPEPTCQL